MSVIKNFFCGQVEFTVFNLPQSCLNKLRNYQLSKIRICDEHTLSFNVPLANTEIVKKLISNFEYKVRQNYNIFRGFNFFLNHLFLVCAVLSALVVYFIADMGIYRVRIQSNDLTLNSAVYERLNQLGVNRFCWKSKIKQLDLGNDLIENFEQVAHTHISISGNTLVINLVTATNKEHNTKKNYYAQYDAVIKEITTYSGTAMVTVGDVVKKGDLLVVDAYPDSIVVLGEVAFVNNDKISRLVIWLV